MTVKKSLLGFIASVKKDIKIKLTFCLTKKNKFCGFFLYFWPKWGRGIPPGFFGTKNCSNFPYICSSIFFKQDFLYVLLVIVTITESQILAAKLPKLQDQNMAIFQTLYWALPRGINHGGTGPGRMEECCNIFLCRF